MGFWKTNGKCLELNLTQELSDMWQKCGLKFCWMNMNSGILEENNDNYYEKKNNKRALKEKVSVKDIAGNHITGSIIHWVRGPCAATPLKDWFIIIPN